MKFVVGAAVEGDHYADSAHGDTSVSQSIDGAGLARVDFFLPHNGGGLVINELNTMPGLTEVSGYPKMWEASGLSFAELLETLIQLAFERHKEKSLTKTTR